MTEKVVLSLDDIETVINYAPSQIGKWPELYTTDKLIMKRYEKFMAKNPEECILLAEDKYSMTFSVHPKCIGIYPRALRKAHFTEEQQRANAERLARMNEKRRAE